MFSIDKITLEESSDLIHKLIENGFNVNYDYADDLLKIHLTAHENQANVLRNYLKQDIKKFDFSYYTTTI
jgi:hypothetical protein